MNGADGPAAASASARKVCARIHQAYRDGRLYPAGHPTAVNTMTVLAKTVNGHLDAYGSLALQVADDTLLLGDEEVYEHGESRDNLAFLMFRDGIRQLTLTPGIEPGELEALVDCLARADQMQDTDHDLSTALWEHDLVHVRLEVVDPFLEGEGATDETFDDLRDTVLRRLSELTTLDKAEAEAKGSPQEDSDPTSGSIGMNRNGQAKIDEESLALTDEEIARGEWLASHPTDPLEEFVVVLLEIVGNPAKLPGAEEAVATALSGVLGRYLDDLNQGGVDLVLGTLGKLEQEGAVPEGTVERVFGGAVTAEHLSRMLTAAASASPEVVQGIERFLSRVRTSIYPALLEALATSDDKVVRKTVLDLLYAEGGMPAQHLWPFMQDKRWYVVRNAVQLAAATGDPELVSHLGPLVSHTDVRVRREVARSLATLSDTKAAPLLARALSDEDSAVRTLAARGLARQGSKSHFAVVQAQLEARDFETRSGEEIEAFLVAYAALGGERTLEVLNRMWKRRVFGTRPLPLRLAAVAALGAVGGAEAAKALSEAMQSGEPQVQRAAAKALGGVQARGRGVDL